MKVIVFGATGYLGREITKALVNKGYDTTAVVRNREKASAVLASGLTCIFADATDKNTLIGICNAYDVVISAMGKSVSPNDRSKPGFRDIDLQGNLNVLEAARKSGTKKFVYISALHSEKYQHLTYFKAHHEFSEALKQSGIDYAIIKPPAIFSAFIDLIDLARKGRLVTMGSGDKKTNPVFEGDLANICVSAIEKPNATIEAGGKIIYTRKHLNEIIQHAVDKNKKIRTVPLAMVRLLLPLVKPFDRNLYDKLAFFTEVMNHDTIAPKLGSMTFEAYIHQKINHGQV